MENLLKMERYQILHNRLYWCGAGGVFLLGFFTADTYVPEVMGQKGGAAASLTDIFNGMIYDSTFLLIILSSLLALMLGQEFSCRTIDLEISAGHSRKAVFAGKVLSYLLAFNCMALIYPIAGCLREVSGFGLGEAGRFFTDLGKGTVYSFLLNSAVFLTAILICCFVQNAAKAAAVTAAVTFAASLYLGYGMMLGLPVFFLPAFQIREAVSTAELFVFPAAVTGVLWIFGLIVPAWRHFCRCDLK